MPEHVDESPQFGARSAPDRGNGPGSSTSYFSGISDAYDSLTSTVDADWKWAKSEASTLWTGTKEEAAHLYAEADKWGNALVGAKRWSELHHIANKLLGAESFNVGLCCGVVENLGEMAWGLVDLVKTLILAGLYQKLHGPIAMEVIDPSTIILRFATPVFDRILGRSMKEANDKLQGMITGIGKIIKDPAKFLGTAFTTTKNDYVKKYNQYLQFFNSGRAIDKFHAGELLGDALTQIILTILAIVSGVGAAARGAQLVVRGVEMAAATIAELTGNLSREAPELLKVAEGMKQAEGAASTAESAAQAAQKAEAAEAQANAAKASKRVLQDRKGEVDSYGELKKTKGDGSVDRDHQPSKAALLRRARQIKGGSLTPAEEARIVKDADAVVVPKDIHRAGDTYGGKNTEALQASDASDLSGAAARDADNMVKNARQLDPENVSKYQSAADQIKSKNNADYDTWLDDRLDDPDD